MRYVPQGGGLVIEERDSDYVFGSGQLKGKVVRPDGDWRAYTPKYEGQRERGIETSACATFGTINCVETLMEEMGLGNDLDYSERFISLLSGTTRQGNSPTKVAETIRRYGLIPQAMMPFDDSIRSWDDFNSWKGADKEKCLAAGRQWLKRYGFGYDRVWSGDVSPEAKRRLMAEARRYSPLGVSVLAWVDEGGEYLKPEGGEDNHWCMSVAEDVVVDTYEPNVKRLKPGYDHLIALRYSVAAKAYEAPTGFWGQIINTLKRIWRR